MATAVTSGVAALVIEASRHGALPPFLGGPALPLPPNAVKAILAVHRRGRARSPTC